MIMLSIQQAPQPVLQLLQSQSVIHRLKNVVTGFEHEQQISTLNLLR